MKTLAVFFAAVTMLFLGAPTVDARVAVTLDVFYDALAPHGDWIYIEDYGYCFRPRATLEDPEWRPYADGHWAFTDAGWTWVSHEDFGWACYHYGRWTLVDDYWVWVPGYEWAPAWVSWRRSPEYVGWAPLPPEAEWEADVGFSVWVDSHYDIGPRCYAFVPVRYFGAPRLRTFVLAPERNITIIRQTRNVTRIVHRTTQANVTNIFIGGPEFDEVNRISEHKIRRLRLQHDAEVEAPALRSGRARNRLRGDEFLVVAPQVEPPAQRVAPPKVAGRASREAINRGWRGIDSSKRAELRQEFERDGADPAADKRPRKRAPKVAEVAAPPPESLPPTDRKPPPAAEKTTAGTQPVPEGKPAEKPATPAGASDQPPTSDRPPARGQAVGDKGRDKVARGKDGPGPATDKPGTTPDAESTARTKPGTETVPKAETTPSKPEKGKAALPEPQEVAPPFGPPATRRGQGEAARSDVQTDDRRGRDRIRRDISPADPAVEDPPGTGKPGSPGRKRRSNDNETSTRRPDEPAPPPAIKPTPDSPDAPSAKPGRREPPTADQTSDRRNSPRERKDVARQRPVEKPGGQIKVQPPPQANPPERKSPPSVQPGVQDRGGNRGGPSGQSEEREEKGKKQKD